MAMAYHLRDWRRGDPIPESLREIIRRRAISVVEEGDDVVSESAWVKLQHSEPIRDLLSRYQFVEKAIQDGPTDDEELKRYKQQLLMVERMLAGALLLAIKKGSYKKADDNAWRILNFIGSHYGKIDEFLAGDGLLIELSETEITRAMWEHWRQNHLHYLPVSLHGLSQDGFRQRINRAIRNETLLARFRYVQRCLEGYRELDPDIRECFGNYVDPSWVANNQPETFPTDELLDQIIAMYEAEASDCYGE